MKLTLFFLVVCGLVAFTVAAPAAEETVQDPEETKKDPQDEGIQ